MNKVSLTGHFCTVNAYTDTSITEEEVIWKNKKVEGRDIEYKCSTLVFDRGFIDVYIPKSYWEILIADDRLSGSVIVEGNLETAVGRGTGIVRNFITAGCVTNTISEM